MSDFLTDCLADCVTDCLLSISLARCLSHRLTICLTAVSPSHLHIYPLMVSLAVNCEYSASLATAFIPNLNFAS